MRQRGGTLSGKWDAAGERLVLEDVKSTARNRICSGALAAVVDDFGAEPEEITSSPGAKGEHGGLMLNLLVTAGRSPECG